MFLRLLSSLICNAQKLIKKYYGYNIKLIKKNKKKSNNILTDTGITMMYTLLIIFGIIFGIGHIYIVSKNKPKLKG